MKEEAWLQRRFSEQPWKGCPGSSRRTGALPVYCFCRQIVSTKGGECVIAFIWCKLGLTFGRTEVAVAKVMFIQPKRHHILLLIHNSEERSCHPACKHRCLKSFPPLAWITMLPNDCIQHTFSSVWVYWVALRLSILVQKIWAMKIIGARIYAQIYFHCIISHHSDKENTVNLLSFW